MPIRDRLAFIKICVQYLHDFCVLLCPKSGLYKVFAGGQISDLENFTGYLKFVMHVVSMLN